MKSSTDCVRVDSARLEKWCVVILMKLGLSESPARLIARTLCLADMRGHPSHGVSRLPRYAKQIRGGEINPSATPKIILELGPIAQYGGENSFGQVAFQFAFDDAIIRAKQHGLALGLISGSNHCGCASFFTEQAARQGLVALLFVTVTGTTRVATFGAKEPRIGTNPIAIAVPSLHEPFSYDSSTSAIVEGKIHMAKVNGEQLTEGLLLTSLGAPTTDPGDAYSSPPGPILPLGGLLNGWKGSGLGIAVDLLAGLLSGAGHAMPGATLGRNGAFFFLVDIGRVRPLEQYRQEVHDYLANWIKRAAPLDSDAPVLVPGEPERLAHEDCLRNGVPLSRGLVQELLHVHQDVGHPETFASALGIRFPLSFN